MSDDSGPRWQRLEPDARRGQILECAIKLFGERPYAAVSTTELAKEAGVARGLINHYYGNKRDLYLEVIRVMVTVPPPDRMVQPAGSLRKKVDACVSWFLDVVDKHGKTWLVAVAGEGMGSDPDVQRILEQADDLAAARVIEALGFDESTFHQDELRAMIRAYGGLIKAASREWIDRKSLTREQVHLLLTSALISIIRDAYPKIDSP